MTLSKKWSRPKPDLPELLRQPCFYYRLKITVFPIKIEEFDLYCYILIISHTYVFFMFYFEELSSKQKNVSCDLDHGPL